MMIDKRIGCDARDSFIVKITDSSIGCTAIGSFSNIPTIELYGDLCKCPAMLDDPKKSCKQKQHLDDRK